MNPNEIVNCIIFVKTSTKNVNKGCGTYYTYHNKNNSITTEFSACFEFK